MAEKTANSNSIIDKLFSAGAHFGYTKSRRHPSTQKFIFGSKGGTDLVDLEQTAAQMEKAMAFIKQLASERKTILFVGGKAEARGSVEHAAKKIGQPYVASRWIGGSLTNWSEIHKRLSRLAELTDKREKGELAKFTKLERLLIDREIADLETMFGGLRGMEKTPHALFVIDPKAEHIAVEEAQRMHIPVVAFMNTDCDTDGIAYPVVGNDASRQSIELVLEEAAKAFDQGALSAPRPTSNE